MLSTTFTPGAPIWLDLSSTDVGATTAFYTGLFGWTTASAGPDTGGYGFFELDGEMVGGFGPVMGADETGSWTPFFGTGDVEATAKSVEQAGGTVRLPPMDVMEFGRMAHFTDPTGGEFAAWQPGSNSGFGVVNVPGSISWVELHTDNGPTALGFYTQVLGWTFEDMQMGPDLVYHVLCPAGSSEAFGGIVALDQLPAVLWQPYFEVTDTDATLSKAVELGATVTMGPETVPGVGRMAALIDPLGAAFAVIATEGRSA
jgi:predicted enzyme related to lactoylglutathione lyase